MRATLSLLGLYRWDNTVLDGLTLPDNFTSAELDTLKSNLLMETAEFEILYPDIDFLKYAITEWCNKRKSTWEWLKRTQSYNYNPLENVDMHLEDEINSNLAKDVVTDFTQNLKSKQSGSDDLDRTDKKTGSDSTQHNVFAYDQNNTGSPESGDTTTYNSQIAIDQSLNYGKTVDDTGTTKNSIDHDESLKRNYEKDWHGRDHVTAQELIKAEQDLAMFNILDFIIDDFKKRFCLLVY